jgi:hypothetical protein
MSNVGFQGTYFVYVDQSCLTLKPRRATLAWVMCMMRSSLNQPRPGWCCHLIPGFP